METQFPRDVGIYLINRLPAPRALSLLERRRVYLADWEAEMAGKQEAARQAHLSSNHLAILDHVHRFIRMEQQWLDELITGIQGDVHAEDDGAAQHLMVLAGNLRRYHLPDLIRLIASGKQTGTLTITDGAVTRRIGFLNGRPTCVASHDGRQPPAEPVPQEAVMTDIEELFRWQEGEFRFEQRLDRWECSTAIDLSVDQLILRGARWVDNWEIINILVPSSETVYESIPGALGAFQEDLSPTEIDVANAIDGVRDVATIARTLGKTIFEVSRNVYTLNAIGAIRATDIEKIRLRRVFREIAELMCQGTLGWRASPGDRSCEMEVNQRCSSLPIQLLNGRILDQADPTLKPDDLVSMYTSFLRAQLDVVRRRFGREQADESYRNTLRRLVPELQEVAHRYHFDRLIDMN